MPFYALQEKKPRIHPLAYVHPSAVVLGEVHIGDACYIGPGAVLRGDWGAIRIGKGTNIQDNCVLHAGPDGEVQLGEDCHIGHGAIIHGATLEDRVLVGMGAIIFDGVHVGSDALIGAGSVLPEGLQLPPRALAAGVPARMIREVSEEQRGRKRLGIALYQTLPELYAKHLREIGSDEVVSSE